jgi:anti-anti-sigma factor
MRSASEGAAVAVVYQDGGPVIQISGELDLSSYDEVRAAVDEVLDAQSSLVVFDLSELQFMDSSGISLFLIAAERVQNVEIRCPSAVVRQLIEISGLTDMFRIAP